MHKALRVPSERWVGRRVLQRLAKFWFMLDISLYLVLNRTESSIAMITIDGGSLSIVDGIVGVVRIPARIFPHRLVARFEEDLSIHAIAYSASRARIWLQYVERGPSGSWATAGPESHDFSKLSANHQRKLEHHKLEPLRRAVISIGHWRNAFLPTM
jgi:hypothetical protein